MVLLGTIVNGICIILGSLIGRFLKQISESTKETVMYAIGLVVIIIGIQMGLKSNQFLVVLLSLVFGTVIGEWWKIEEKLNQLGRWLEVKLKAQQESQIAKGFVVATLIFSIGSMAILGALDSGIRGDHNLLYMKAIIDGFTALILASTLGLGVLFSAVPVVVYQGIIALCATQITKFVPSELLDSFIVDMTSTGGIMIIAIGLNIMGLTKIRVANMLPSIIVVAFITSAIFYSNF